MRDSLNSNSFLETHDISTFEGRIKYLDLTEKAENILCEMGYNIKKKRESSPKHYYWKYRIAESFKSKGYQVEM